MSASSTPLDRPALITLNDLDTMRAPLPHALRQAAGDIGFVQLCLDSRQVADQDVLVLLTSQRDCDQAAVMMDYAKSVQHKAAFIITEIALDEAQTSALACLVIAVDDIRSILGDLAQAVMQQRCCVPLPKVAAVTGTNGKTTISQLIAQLTQLSGNSSAVMGTAGNGKLGALTQARHTTSDALTVQQFLYQMGAAGVDTLALEASSHGLDQDRLQGVPVTVAVYTNLSRDHLDYHADMSEYAAAKAKLFDKKYFPDLTHAIINRDDDHARIMIDTATASGLTVWTYSLLDDTATFFAAQIEPSLQGAAIAINSKFGSFDVTSPLLGRFNVANVLAAIAAAHALGVDLSTIKTAVPKLEGAVGRMQRVPSKTGCFIVDYAHTPDALTQVLASLRAHCDGKLWAVFGCGGDRDAGKRPIMAQAGFDGADMVVLTSDNPRTEDPEAILVDMQKGISAAQYSRSIIEPNRRCAIDYVAAHAGADDVVVIAGKGHETYQEINGVRYDFDDSVVLNDALSAHKRAP